MSKVTLNKSVLKQERDRLQLFRQFLPSLDLKRQQLLFDVRKARREREELDAKAQELFARSADWIALLANDELNLSGLVKVEGVELGEETRLGVTLPVLGEVKVEVADYSLLAQPLWVDALVDALAEMARLRVLLQVAEERQRRLEEALQTITQRVNLFDQILIPSATENIRTIRIALSDMERAGVIRSKLAKAKRARRRE